MRTADPIGATDRAADLAAAPQVDGLWLTRRLGVGAHGQVWLASDPRTGDRVAVKMVRDDLLGDQAVQAAERLANEAQVLARVRHPHLIRLRGTVDDALVLDHLPGGSVADLVAARGPLDPAEVTTVVVPVARALAALHAAGIVHGDVTAANVLLGGDGHPVLADLGAAAEVRTTAAAGGSGVARAGVVRSVRPGASAVAGRARPTPPVLSPVVWGTPGWVDPGAATGRPGPWQDIWGLGALIRFCLTATVVAEAMPPARNARRERQGQDAGDASLPDDDLLLDAADGRHAMLRVAQACCGDRQHRPSAEQVAALVWQAAAAAPIAMPPAVGPSAPELTRQLRVGAGASSAGGERRGRRADRLRHLLAERLLRSRLLSGWPRPGWAAGVLAAGVAAGSITAVVVAHTVGAVPVVPDLPELTGAGPVGAASPVASSAPVGRGPSGTAEPVLELGAVVARLAAARSAAIGSGSEAALAQVDVPGSAAEAQDRALLRRLADAGRRLVGLQFSVAQVTPEGQVLPSGQVTPPGQGTSPGRGTSPGQDTSWRQATSAGMATSAGQVSVVTVITTSAHVQVDRRTAAVVAEVPAGKPQRLRLVLTRVSDGWRVAVVQSLPEQT